MKPPHLVTTSQIRHYANSYFLRCSRPGRALASSHRPFTQFHLLSFGASLQDSAELLSDVRQMARHRVVVMANVATPSRSENSRKRRSCPCHHRIVADLVSWGREFDRTPVAQGDNCRDHNPQDDTMWLAGGGMKPGIRNDDTDDYGYCRRQRQSPPARPAWTSREGDSVVTHSSGKERIDPSHDLDRRRRRDAAALQVGVVRKSNRPVDAMDQRGSQLRIALVVHRAAQGKVARRRRGSPRRCLRHVSIERTESFSVASRFAGRDFLLTDVHGEVVCGLLA